MTLPRFFSDEAFVLKRTNYSEADRLLVVFTKNHGKLFVTAKGARKSTSKKAPHIELFTHTKLYFAATNHTTIVTQAQTIQDFPLLKADLSLVRAAFHLNEIIDKLFPEAELAPGTFGSLVQLFHSLNTLDLSAAQRQHLITHFQIQLLDQLGFGRPILTSPSSVYAYLEDVLDQRLKAAKSLL